MPPSAPTHDESSRFDFVEGVRRFNYRRIVAPLLDDFERRALSAGVARPCTREDVEPLYVTDPHYLFACALQRSAQRMGWATAAASVERDRAARAADLAATAATHEHSVLELDPGIALPKWYTAQTDEGRDDIHLVRGGYWAEPLVGAVYDRGGAVYRLAWREGYDARPGALDHFAATAPADDHRRVLDLGCSFGGLTRVLRKAFPDAEVVGIDLSAAALTYAHHLAERDGQRITYAQRDAAATGYPDDSFDLVAGFLLLHEVPDAAREEIVAEAHRILRPGGRLMFLDIPPYHALAPQQAFFESFDGRGNGETFWEDFLASDFTGLLAATGFVDVTEGALAFEDPEYWGSSALWRTGEFDPVHRWVTAATKPAADGGPR